MKNSAAVKVRSGRSLKRRLADNWQLYLLLLVPVVITIIYKYGPMYGIQIAFRDFKPSRGITGSFVSCARIPALTRMQQSARWRAETAPCWPCAGRRETSG